VNVRRLAPLVLAVTVAGLTAYVVNSQLAHRGTVLEALPAPATPAPVLPEILVAKTALPAGTFIKPELLAWRPWPKEGIGDSYLVKGAFAEKDLVGAVVRTPLHADEPITRSRVVHPGEQGFLAAVLEPGRRAVAIPVDATSGVAGFVFPGDFVDVLFTLKRTVSGDGEDAAEVRQFSQTLITDVRVLAIDQTLDNGNAPAKVGRTATLQVTTRQAERLALAMSMGSLSLSLRSLARRVAGPDATGPSGARPGDAPSAGRSAGTYTRDMDVLFMIGDPLGLPPPLALRRKVEVLRGSESKQVRF
jgi:pilus assembly protein CpaB